MSFPIPENEEARLAALRACEILDTSPEHEFDSLTRLAAKICGTPIALVTLLDSERQWFKSKIGVETSQTPREIAFCSHTILSDQPLLVPDLRQDPRFANNPMVISDPNIRFYCGVPLEIEKGLGVGTLCVIDCQPRQLSLEQVEDLAVLAQQVTAQLKLRKAVRDLDGYRCHLEEMVERRTSEAQAALKHIEVTYDDTLQALGAALDLRDNETAGHSRRVTRYCLEMARRMGYKGADLKSLERGSYLHDIGKIGIPDSVLLKPGALDANERRVMESHVRIGYKLVNHISFLSDSAELVLCHQERFDGTGYPRGMKGSEIPLGARIFSVADTLDAMTSDRPYRLALPFAEARAEIVHGSGTQFDPNVVAVFLATPENAWEDIRREVSSRYGSLHSSAAAGG
jgi:putative nucleotidyltransferase with HDIG domain